MVQGSGDEYVDYQPALQADSVRLGRYGEHSSGGGSDEDDFVNTVPFEPQLAPPGIELQVRTGVAACVPALLLPCCQHECQCTSLSAAWSLRCRSRQPALRSCVPGRL